MPSLAKLLTDCTGLALDSRRVAAGNIFFAFPGTSSDGRDYLEQAEAAGALAIIAEKNGYSGQAQLKVPVLLMDNLSARISAIASEYYQYPSRKCRVIGVTGTNGKTSTTYFLAQVLAHCQHRCGIIGTLGWGELDHMTASGLTTPDPIHVQRALESFVEKQIHYVAMEASSHALDQHRLAAVEFSSAIFTNFTHDHLDYHGTMEAYGEAKAKLFEFPSLKQAVINSDDPFSATLKEKAPFAMTYSVKNAKADIFAHDIQATAEGIQAKVVTPWGQSDCFIPLLGEFQLQNALGVIGCLGQYEFSLDDIIAGLATLECVPGRMQRIVRDDKPLVVIDYAHTPDALEHALVSLRPLTRGKLWVVFGCGGDRDKSKRPEMGAIAAEHADHIVLTNDNPRTELPAEIIQQIAAAIPAKKKFTQELDRHLAIQSAVNQAAPDDVILVAGKGHENYQIIGETRFNFSDYDCALSLLSSEK